MLKHLNEVNDVKIYSVFDDEFKSYGKVLQDLDFSEALRYMENRTPMPEENNIYVPSDSELEKLSVFGEVESIVYGSMPIQVGYCNGKNSTYNGFEYHKGSEINVAAVDMMLVLGHVWQMKDMKFYVGDEKVFFVPKGTAVELYQTTLHLSPCKCSSDGFKAIVVLPLGTNTPFEKKPESDLSENRLLLDKNKWVIAHKDRKQLIGRGAYPGLIGENKELKY